MQEIKQKIKWIVANHTSVAEADPLNTELEDELFDLFSQALQKRDKMWKIEILSLGTPTFHEGENRQHFNGRRAATEQIKYQLLSTLTTK